MRNFTKISLFTIICFIFTLGIPSKGGNVLFTEDSFVGAFFQTYFTSPNQEDDLSINYLLETLRAESASADEVISFRQGLNRKGKAVASDRNNPNLALGTPQGGDAVGSFVSLGFGGELVLKFAQAIVNGQGNDLRVVETSYGNPTCQKYPEQVEVFVSKNGTDWTSLGVSCLDSDFELGQLDWIQFVKLVDKSKTSDFSGDEDGYDVDGLLALNGIKPVPPATPLPEPVVCAKITITKALNGILIKNDNAKEVIVSYTIYDNTSAILSTSTITVAAKSSYTFTENIPANGKVVFGTGADDIANSIKGDVCAIKTGTKTVEAGTKIETIQVFENKVYDARSWDWFNPIDNQVLKDKDGKTVEETDKGVSLKDLTNIADEAALRVDSKVGAVGYNHVVGYFTIVNGLPNNPQVLFKRLSNGQSATTTVKGAIPANSSIGFFLTGQYGDNNILAAALAANPNTKIRFSGTTLQFSSDGTNWTDVPKTQVVTTIKEWNINSTEQAIAGVVKVDGKDVLRVGFEDIAGGGDRDFEDNYLTVYLSGAQYLKTKETKITKEVDVLTELPCGSCKTTIEGDKYNDPTPLTCSDVRIFKTDKGDVQLTNPTAAAVNVSYSGQTITLAAGESKLLASASLPKGKTTFTVTYKDAVVVDGTQKCAVKTGTKTLTTYSQLPSLVSVNDKVYDAKSWSVFQIKEGTKVTYIGGKQLNPLDYGVSLKDLTTITDEVNLRVDAKLGVVASKNIVGWFTIDANGYPQNPKILYEMKANKILTSNIPSIPKGTKVGFFNISYKPGSVDNSNDLKYLRFKPNGSELQYSKAGQVWDNVTVDKLVQVQTTIESFNAPKMEMTIGGTISANGKSLLNVGFENNYYADFDYEDITLTVYFSPEMVYTSKTVSESKTVDVFTEVPCTCSYEIDNSEVVDPNPKPFTCDQVTVTQDGNGVITLKNNAQIPLVVSYTGKSVELAKGESKTIAEKAPAGGKLEFKVLAKDLVPVEGQNKCAVKSGTMTTTTTTKVPVLVAVNNKVYDAKSWSVFQIEEGKKITFTGGKQLNPLDYGVSLNDLTTITDEPNLQIVANIGATCFLNTIGWFKLDSNGNPVDPKILFAAPHSGSKNLVSTLGNVAKGTRLGFFIIPDGCGRTNYGITSLATVEFKSGKLYLNGTIAPRVHYSIESMNPVLEEMAIGGTTSENYLNVGFEDLPSGNGNDYDYEDVKLTVKFSADMVYETKTVTDIKTVDLYTTVPCDACTYSVTGTDTAPVLTDVSLALKDATTSTNVCNDFVHTFTVKNVSSANASNVLFTYAAPQGATVNEITATGGVTGANNTISFANISPGTEILVTVKGHADNAGSYTGQASVSVVTPSESVLTNNTSSATTVVNPQAKYDVGVVQTFNSVSSGSGVDYKVTVSNNSSATIENLKVDLQIPGAFDLTGLEMSLNGQAFNGTIASLASGSSVDIYVNSIYAPVVSVSTSYDFGVLVSSNMNCTVINNTNSAPVRVTVDPIFVNDYGINDTQESIAQPTRVNIYPNPTVDFVTVAFDQIAFSVVSAQVIDNKGQIVYEQSQRLNGAISFDVDLKRLNPGSYILRVSFDGKVQTLKLLKQ